MNQTQQIIVLIGLVLAILWFVWRDFSRCRIKRHRISGDIEDRLDEMQEKMDDEAMDQELSGEYWLLEEDEEDDQ